VFNRVLAALVLLLLAACQPAADPARPALWQVDGPSGERAWLLGTIHALPDPVSIDSPAFAKASAEATSLIVEVAALEDSKRTALAFHILSAVEAAPPLSERAAPQDRAALAAMLTKAGLSQDRFAQMDTWAAALTLAQLLSARSGERSANGIDRLVLEKLRGKPVYEFEGAERQLAIFDRLPEQEQRDLLGLVIRSAGEGEAESAQLRAAYLTGDIDQLAALDHRGLLADAELRQALLVGRNRAWLDQLGPILQRGEKPLVAVGALHLVGSDGLVAGLAARGYRITRLQ
jgi:uncharacterized protein YbaP (TraB family)